MRAQGLLFTRNQTYWPVVGVAVELPHKDRFNFEIRHTVTKRDHSGAYGSFQTQPGNDQESTLAGIKQC